MSASEMKSVVASAIAAKADSLNQVSQQIWKNPELNYDETKAHAVLTDFLEENGFVVQRGYHVATAFRAEFTAPGGPGEVTVCIMCEYDALPEIGHACGHNLIAEAGVGAALGVKAAMQKNKQITGKLVVMGTPAEEGGGGKILLLNAGALKDVDFAMMAHPTIINSISMNALAIQEVTVKFIGREAHASAAPWEGINALDAAVAAYSNIALCRQQMQPTWRVHGIITKGGVKPNIIPGETEMNFLIRAPNMVELDKLVAMVTRCFEAAAWSTGCKMEQKGNDANRYDSILRNEPMLEAYKNFAEAEGVKFQELSSAGSTDMGNVSHAVPSIHPMFAIPATGANHTKEFTTASGAAEAQAPTLVTAQSLALTTLQLFTDPQLRKASKDAFIAAQKESVNPLLDSMAMKAYAEKKLAK